MGNGSKLLSKGDGDLILSWNVTKRCNLFCEHCYRESDMKHYNDELTLDEGKKLIDGIAKTKKFKILILSGGEPLLRNDIYDLIEYTLEKGIMPVLGTNATMIDKSTALKLKNSGIKALGISLDSCNSKEHDLFRSSKGAFDKTIEGIKNAVELGIKVQVNTTITKNNVNEFDDILELSENLGASALHPFFLVEAGRGKKISDKKLDDKSYIEALEYILKRSKNTKLEIKPTCAPQYIAIANELGINMRFTRGCIAGISYCCILPNGKVNVCPYMPVEAGDLREKSFDEVWENSEVFNNLRNRENYFGSCSTCMNFNICGGCRARAYHQNGDYLGPDPISYLCHKENMNNE